MTEVQQVVTTRGRHQIVLLGGAARDAARDRYAVTTLAGAVIGRDLTHDEAQSWLARLWTAAGADIPCSAIDASPVATPARAMRVRR